MKNATAMDFYEEHFIIHGQFNNTVYRDLRNGSQQKYPYEPVSYYKRTPLTIRNECIRKYAAIALNPRDRGYKSVIRKLNYYTPYILPIGSQKFRAETVFYVREKGDYEFLWAGSDMGNVSTVCKRTNLRYSFHSLGEKLLNVYCKDGLYCQRWFVISDADDLDAEYEEWLQQHYLEALAMPEPDYESLKKYRRGMQSRRIWIHATKGKLFEDVHFTRKDLRYKDVHRQNPYIFHRKQIDHSGNPQTIAFNAAMPAIGAEWQALSAEEKQYWNKKARKLRGKRITGFNLFTSHRTIHH